MASTGSEIDAALDQIAATITQSRKEQQRALQQLQSASATLGNLQTQYTQLVADVNTAATDNPDSQLAQIRKERMDERVAEFLALKSSIDAQITALTG